MCKKDVDARDKCFKLMENRQTSGGMPGVQRLGDLGFAFPQGICWCRFAGHTARTHMHAHQIILARAVILASGAQLAKDAWRYRPG
jgi:hypothetical protein